ncbi:TrbI/VirB10 family protein [Phenylobacterium soli]|uniref:Conjugal transfer protein TraI n=1 Tax=Phenylobacterium soli TaxID=2170551 RepID=A0A328AK93_9CAUL|nr:TrbI/VirB10 family protein [Phenylobacterium soli]RAK54937.1 conjugal transfer protein TraI [Phenylobacterium soli]
MSAAAHPREREIAADLRLRAARPPVARLSRKVLLVGTATACVAIAGAVAYAMAARPGAASRPELYAVGGPPPERLAALPADYAAAPKLGPPLPGDLGKPILAAGAPAPTMGAAPSASPEQQRLVQEGEAARTSRLFANEAELRADPSPSNVGGEPVVGQGARAVLDGPVDRRTVSPDRLSAPASPYLLQAGSVIPAALVSGIRSDLPGQVLGQVTQDVFDSVTGRFLLIPQGSKLIGLYDSQIANGQRRVLLAWTRLILPNGKSLVLEKLPAGDAAGYAGLEDQVDRHWGALFGAATLSTILGVGAELGAGYRDSAILRALRLGTSDTFNQVGQQAVGRALSIPPTLTIRPGMPVRVLVAKDLVLEPYSG